MKQRQHELRAALHDVRAAQAVADQRLVRPDLAQHARERREENDDDGDGESGDDDDGMRDGIH